MPDEAVFGALGQTVEDAVRNDLARLPQDMREGGVARIALYCAEQLDSGMHAPRDAAGFARELRLSLAQLREMAPGEVKGDVTDEVRERRERRLAEGSLQSILRYHYVMEYWQVRAESLKGALFTCGLTAPTLAEAEERALALVPFSPPLMAVTLIRPRSREQWELRWDD